MKSKTLPSFWDAYQTLPDRPKRPRENPTNSAATRRSTRRYVSNVLNKKNVSGPSVLRETTGLWVFWKVTRHVVLDWQPTRTTNGNSNKPTGRKLQLNR